MWVENENGVTDHMLDEILERLRDDADALTARPCASGFRGCPSMSRPRPCRKP